MAHCIIRDHLVEQYTMLITRRLEFDAGHRIPDHKSQCRHLPANRSDI